MGLFGFGKSKEEKKRLKDKAEEEFLKYSMGITFRKLGSSGEADYWLKKAKELEDSS